MNRNEEYIALKSELEQTPPELESAMTRLKARAKKKHPLRRFLLVFASALSAVFVAFFALVNLSAPFALAMEGIPVLRDLTMALTRAPSLSAAVDNGYVQPVSYEQTKKGVTMRIESVIADEKQVNIFYTLYTKGENPEDRYDLDGEDYFKQIRGLPYDASYVFLTARQGALQHIALYYNKKEVPETLALQFVMTGMTFDFDLRIDKESMKKGEKITLDDPLIIDGQELNALAVEIYPTHMRLTFEENPANTKNLDWLNFYFENELGERFDTVKYGITGRITNPKITHEEFLDNAETIEFLGEDALAPEEDALSDNTPIYFDSEKAEHVHYADSPYFSEGQHLTLYITGSAWMDKNLAPVKVDFANATAEGLPENVMMSAAYQEQGGSHVVFYTMMDMDNWYAYPVETTFRDETGKKYEYEAEFDVYRSDGLREIPKKYTPGIDRTLLSDATVFKLFLPFYEQDIACFTPWFSKIHIPDEPGAITVK